VSDKASKGVLRDKAQNLCKVFFRRCRDALNFSWHAQLFGRVHLHFAPQAGHFRRVAFRVSGELQMSRLCEVVTTCELETRVEGALQSPLPTLYTYTRHPTLYTLHFTLYTPHFAHDTSHSTLYTVRFTLYPPHLTLRTLHLALYT
jgi:hypothetical protein